MSWQYWPVQSFQHPCNTCKMSCIPWHSHVLNGYVMYYMGMSCITWPTHVIHDLVSQYMGRPETHVIHDIFHVLQEDREYGLSGGTPETTTIIIFTTCCAHRYIFQVRLFRVLIYCTDHSTRNSGKLGSFPQFFSHRFYEFQRHGEIGRSARPAGPGGAALQPLEQLVCHTFPSSSKLSNWVGAILASAVNLAN